MDMRMKIFAIIAVCTVAIYLISIITLAISVNTVYPDSQSVLSSRTTRMDNDTFEFKITLYGEGIGEGPCTVVWGIRVGDEFFTHSRTIILENDSIITIVDEVDYPEEKVENYFLDFQTYVEYLPSVPEVQGVVPQILS